MIIIKSKLSETLKKQGKSKNDSDSGFDKLELKIGTLIEMEHTNDKDVAKEICKDHLCESMGYYRNKIFAKERIDALKQLKLKKTLSIKNDIIEFLKKNHSPKDSEVHDFSIKKGYDKHKVRELIYKLDSKQIKKSIIIKSTSKLLKAIRQSKNPKIKKPKKYRISKFPVGSVKVSNGKKHIKTTTGWKVMI